eukprot:5178426-Pyramimonas_sp.AAC.1
MNARPLMVLPLVWRARGVRGAMYTMRLRSCSATWRPSRQFSLAGRWSAGGQPMCCFSSVWMVIYVRVYLHI